MTGITYTVDWNNHSLKDQFIFIGKNSIFSQNPPYNHYPAFRFNFSDEIRHFLPTKEMPRQKQLLYEKCIFPYLFWKNIRHCTVKMPDAEPIKWKANPKAWLYTTNSYSNCNVIKNQSSLKTSIYIANF